MTAPLKGSVKRVHDALAALGHTPEIVRFAESTRSSEDAAVAVGCRVGQIAKSLVFRTREMDQPVLVIASGANQVDPERVGKVLGHAIARVDADYVRKRTGFAIGGVAPLGHKERLLTVIDRDLLGYDEIWAAAGAPNAVFRLDPRALEAITDGAVADVKALT